MRVRRESGTRRLEYEIPRFKFTSETVGRMSEKALDFSDETGCGAAQDDLAVVKRSALLKSRDQVGHGLGARFNETLLPPVP